MNNILVIAPHPDDETLGCGGTLFRHKNDGDKTYWLILTGISKDLGWTKESINKRDNEIEVVAEKYGFSDVFNLRLPNRYLQEDKTEHYLYALCLRCTHRSPNNSQSFAVYI